MKKLLLVILLVSGSTFAQSARRDSIWKPMKYFIGDWVGTGEGESGKGSYERSYKPALGQFIEIRNKATYPATEKKPKGEVHEDIGYVSYDKGRKKFALRQFHIEGFVNTFYLDNISADGKTIEFVTEQIENIPAGFRARETYKIISEDEFVETFELAEPGKEFFVYSTATIQRKK